MRSTIMGNVAGRCVSLRPDFLSFSFRPRRLRVRLRSFLRSSSKGDDKRFLGIFKMSLFTEEKFVTDVRLVVGTPNLKRRNQNI